MTIVGTRHLGKNNILCQLETTCNTVPPNFHDRLSISINTPSIQINSELNSYLTVKNLVKQTLNVHQVESEK